MNSNKNNEQHFDGNDVGSFIEDPKENDAAADRNESPTGDEDHLRNYYFSPTSTSTNTNDVSRAPVMETIQHTPAPRKNSSDGGVTTDASVSTPKNIPPVHPFFSPSFYDDSDGSDGSIVFNYQPGIPTKKGRHRERSPSSESFGSAGSIRYVAAGSQPSLPPGPVPNASAASSVDPQFLPYHERRKLSLKKQQQQQQKTTRVDPTPPRPERPQYMMSAPPNDFGFPHLMQQPLYPGMYTQTQPGMNMQTQPGMPVMHPQPGMHMMYSYPTQPYPQIQPHPPHQPYSQPQTHPPPQPRHSPYQTVVKSGAPNAKMSSRTVRGYQPQPQQGQHPQYPPSAPPPGGTPRHQGHLSATHSSSFDSSGSPEKEDRQQRPPPPPPPLPPNYAHVRNDSVGSVSSLGSMVEDEKQELPRAPAGRRRTGSENEGFFQKINPWSPKSPTVNEFHRKNQAFLKRSSNDRQNQSKVALSPRTQQRLKSMDMPPPSRGTHKRLSSIDGDDWEEGGETTSPDTKPPRPGSRMVDASTRSYSQVSSSPLSSSEESDYDGHYAYRRSDVPDERTSLLPPTGISSNEQNDVDEHYSRDGRRRGRQSSRSSKSAHLQQQKRAHQGYGADRNSQRQTMRMDNTTASALLEYQYQIEQNKRKQKEKKSRRRSRKHRELQSDDYSDDSISTSESSQDYRRWMKKRAKMLEKEREKLIAQWREEAREQEEQSRWNRRLSRYLDKEMGTFLDNALKFLTWFESFIANLPLTIGAIALAIATLGVVWFKFAEENLDSCEPVHFHSSQCSFPEFPGCFYCRDQNALMYRVGVNFHYACSIFAFVLAVSFLLKLLLARQVVFDELSSPTTASPAGLICMTIDVVAAGRGFVGQVLVSTAASVHLCLVIWFIYMALAYHIMPEPSWFPNTVSIGMSAVKVWLYYPMCGHFLMAISLSLNFFFFPISLIRVVMNKKISATVGWMQMSAPNISLYALTIMAQPSFKEEHPDINKFQKVHRQLYLPCMHFLFAMAVIGMAASLISLKVRWHDFRKLPFSPAHAAFCTPTLSHANAVQAYRAAVNSFSDYVPGKLGLLLYVYWVLVLVGGTIATIIISSKFLVALPAWTHIDVEDEIEPPAPYETTMTLSNMISTGETLVQPFVSPAVLQANETGALVLTRNARGQQRFVRTRKVTALGFEPIMDLIDMERERDVLLDWVGKNPPRRRHRTLSVPGIDFSYGANIGTGNSGVYGMGAASPVWPRRQRANTVSPQRSQSRSRGSSDSHAGRSQRSSGHDSFHSLK